MLRENRAAWEKGDFCVFLVGNKADRPDRKVDRAAAEAVAHRYAENGEDIRIDVILLAPGSFPRHIPNAWQP